VAKENLLIVADSERNADLRYAVGVSLPDTFIWFTHRSRPFVVAHDLALERLRTAASHCRILSYTTAERRLVRELNGDPVGLGDVLGAVLRGQRIKKVTVSESFPLGLARALRSRAIKVRLRSGPFFPDRAWKTADEVKKIVAALTMAEVGMAEGLHALRRTKRGKGNKLLLQNTPLTSERLRGIIDTAILQSGGIPTQTIVAGGRQSADPHERGFGPLLANQPIVIDVFPRSQLTGYHADISRTVVRGRASETVRRMFAAVREAQDLAVAETRHGVAASQIHRSVEGVFRRHQFKTRRRLGRPEGFFHPAGHGIGLELHEAPRISARSRESLRAGHVVSIEPGLYFPEIGGVRLEDVIHVTRRAPENLTHLEKQLEWPFTT
jgi:Xaa-Pro aminopeptidase